MDRQGWFGDICPKLTILDRLRLGGTVEVSVGLLYTSRLPSGILLVVVKMVKSWAAPYRPLPYNGLRGGIAEWRMRSYWNLKGSSDVLIGGIT